MRLSCPHCGERGTEEFTYLGSADPVRPAPEADLDTWHEYVHLRTNPMGPNRELWHHVHGCRRWVVVTRNTLTHEVLGAQDAAEFVLARENAA